MDRIYGDITPSLVAHPGESVEEAIEERGWTQAELATRLGVTKKAVNDLVKGRVDISGDMATGLGMVLGPNADFWTRLQAQYDKIVRRTRALESYRDDLPWLKSLPLAWLRAEKYLRRFALETEEVEAALSWFGVRTRSVWDKVYGQPVAAYRAQDAKVVDDAAAASWLRACELQAGDIQCEAFDPDKLKAAIPRIKALTLQTAPGDFSPPLQRICAECGVAVVFVSAPPKCPVSGATKWNAANKRMTVGLTLRYHWADSMWFTLFHEFAHILNDSRKVVFIEFTGKSAFSSEIEKAADQWAGEQLVPKSQSHRLPGLKSAAAIVQFANEIGVHPGIIVGRLQHDRLLNYSQHNNLRVRYQLTPDEEM
jgi:HTH-type transcriptional regulator/antitoxin HigA